MTKERIEKFQGYCPTQDKWEIVEQTYLNVTSFGTSYSKFIPGLLTCPYISFHEGNCASYNSCPIVKGEWSSETPDVVVALQFNTPDGFPRTIVDDVIRPVTYPSLLIRFFCSIVKEMNIRRYIKK